METLFYSAWSDSLFKSFKTFNIEKKYKEKQLDYLLKGKKNTFIIGVSFENYINLNSGYVITIENITELIKIQRTAAWSDIAKKIAHEIKNALTPIQLSADRLNIK